MTWRLAHLSDTHLAYEAYAARSARGNNQRGEDVVRAFTRQVDGILALDPPLVIHSGDLFERAVVPTNYLVLAVKQFQRLTGIRANGTRRQVVLIAGNHDQSANRKDTCVLEALSGIPGLHVVTTDYTLVTFRDLDAPGELQDTVVHAIPHDTLRFLDALGPIKPLPDKINILTTHGVAEGSALYIRALGREYAIPEALMHQKWDYVALGHWHKQGPVHLDGKDHANRDSKIWYAGSSEHISFRDLRGPGEATRGWLEVEIKPGDMPGVTPKRYPVRKMLRLPLVDCSTLNPEQIAQALLDAARAGDLDGTITVLPVHNVAREIWALVDKHGLAPITANAVHFELDVRYTRPQVSGADQEITGNGGAEQGLRHAVAEQLAKIDEPDRAAATTLVNLLLGNSLKDSQDQQAPDSVELEAAND